MAFHSDDMVISHDLLYMPLETSEVKLRILNEDAVSFITPTA